jgi:hypothetical protein
MTEDFAESRWTDQEVGVAIGRRVPIIPVRLGADPYGFIGKYQGVAGARKDGNRLGSEVYELLWAKPILKARMIESLVTRFEASGSFHQANVLMGYLDRIENTTPHLIDRLAAVSERNSQVAGAFDVQEKLPKLLERLRAGRG